MTRDAVPLPGYPAPYDLLCGILQDSTQEWRWEVDPDLGPDAVTWQARPGGHNIGGIILHMIHAELYWLEMIALGRQLPQEVKDELLWDQIDIESGRWPAVPHQPLSWYFALQDKYRAQTLEAVKSWAPADTLVPQRDDKCSLRYIFGHVIQHDSYHGGQIVLLNDLWKALRP
jgi:uncharacterized damage-inducible protein DinB